MNSVWFRNLLVFVGTLFWTAALPGDDAPNQAVEIGKATLPEDDEEEAPPKVTPTPKPVTPPAAPIERPKTLTSDEVRELVRQLANEKFEVREAATKRLGEAGPEAVAPLAEAAQGTSLEVTCRSIRTLEAIAQRGDRDTFEVAQEALEKLTESKVRSAANRAAVALTGLGAARSRHARARIIELGAIIKPRTPIRGIIDDDDSPVRIQVILNRRWKGGEAGLAYLRRMDPAELDTVYVTRGSKISKDAMIQLEESAPHLKQRVMERGDAMLGVACDEIGMCLVSRVAPGTAAERCGLQEGDIIVKYAGEEISSFKQLTDITRNYEAGDKVKIEVRRDDEILQLEATLGEWE